MKTCNCNYCDKELKPLGKSIHERYCVSNPNKLIKGFGGPKKGCITWNKGMSMSQSFKNKISESLKGKSTGIASTKEKEESRKLKISQSMKQNPNAGGLRRGSGRGYKGYYKNVWCDSTWELAWVIYHIDNKIEFIRNTEGFSYEYEGKIHKYYPDFICDGVYFEIKGRRSYSDLDDKTKAKINSFKHDLVILYEKDMLNMINYVKLTYDKDLKKLFDN